jgi:large subunit ribosomal protein L29
MKASEIRAKTREELIDELIATQKERFSLLIQKNTGGAGASTPRSHSFRQVRRKVARIKTILNEKTRERHE